MPSVHLNNNQKERINTLFKYFTSGSLSLQRKVQITTLHSGLYIYCSYCCYYDFLFLFFIQEVKKEGGAGTLTYDLLVIRRVELKYLEVFFSLQIIILKKYFYSKRKNVIMTLTFCSLLFLLLEHAKFNVRQDSNMGMFIVLLRRGRRRVWSFHKIKSIDRFFLCDVFFFFFFYHNDRLQEIDDMIFNNLCIL